MGVRAAIGVLLFAAAMACALLDLLRVAELTVPGVALYTASLAMSAWAIAHSVRRRRASPWT